MNIGFIGIGKLGMPCAEVIAKFGHYVKGYDIVTQTSSVVDVVNNIADVVENSDIVFIAVPTPHDPAYDGREPTAHLEPKDFSYNIVKDCLIEANKLMNNNQLLVLISTVLPGTTRRELAPLVTNTRFVYNPYLIAMGSVAWDMINPEMVMIGTEDGNVNGDAKKLTDFYKTIMQNDPRYEVGTWDECECMKVFYNTFISAKIGLVNMIQDVAMQQGNIDVDVVTNALAQSNMRIMGPQYMKAGMGDGGGCHPRDNIALRYLAGNLNLGYDLFGAIMDAREVQASNIANLLIEKSKESKLPIYIHGKSYKPLVPYEDGSYSILIGSLIQDLGYDVKYIDPMIPGCVTDNEVKGVILLAHSASTTYKYTGNNTPDKLYTNFLPGSIVIDPWRSYNNSNCEVIHYGNTRRR